MKHIFRLGIIGYPLHHTLSPYLHRYILEEIDKEAYYVPYPVIPDRLKEAIAGIRALDIDGINVTVPYKEKVIPLLDQISEEAERIGAVNTVKNRNDTLIGFNTDTVGFRRTLQENEIPTEGTRAIVLGAGGAARAVLYSLIEEGIDQISLFNRTYQNAETLCKEMSEITGFSDINCYCLDDDKLSRITKSHQILINTTPVGMYPQQDKSPLDKEVNIPDGLAVIDLIYNPIKTELLRRAEESGAKTANGLDMLIYQGIESLNIWLDTQMEFTDYSGLSKYLEGRLTID